MRKNALFTSFFEVNNLISLYPNQKEIVPNSPLKHHPLPDYIGSMSGMIIVPLAADCC